MWQDESGRVTRESAIVSCCHCGSMVITHDELGQERDDATGYCPLCDKATCSKCAAIPQCKPFERQLEEREARGRLLAVIGVGR